jgi:hypothetical protein
MMSLSPSSRMITVLSRDERWEATAVDASVPSSPSNHSSHAMRMSPTNRPVVYFQWRRSGSTRLPNLTGKLQRPLRDPGSSGHRESRQIESRIVHVIRHPALHHFPSGSTGLCAALSLRSTFIDPRTFFTVSLLFVLSDCLSEQ